MAQKKQQELTTEISESARAGEYSNFVKIQHSAIDFRLDFAKIIPEDGVANIHTRMFMSPIHAKMFARAMIDNVEKYEKKFGVIQLKIEKGIPVTNVVSQETH